MKNHNYQNLRDEVPQYALPAYDAAMEELWYGGEAVQKASEALHAAQQRELTARLAAIALATEAGKAISADSPEYIELRRAQEELNTASKHYYEVIDARMKLTAPVGIALEPVYRAIEEEKHRQSWAS